MTNSQPNLGNSFANAKSLARIIGAIPSSFSTTVRSLISSHRADRKVCSRVASGAMSRLLSSPTLLANYYYYSENFPESRRLEEGKIEKEDIVRRFDGPLHLATTLMLSYLYKRAKRLCPTEEFNELGSEVHRMISFATELGFGIDEMGPGYACLAEGFHILAKSVFLAHDSKSYMKYQNHLKTSGKLHDFDKQIELWGCTQVEVASCILQNFGCGIDLTRDLSESLLTSSMPEESNTDQYLFYLAAQWMRSLLLTKEPPEFVHQGKYYPLETSLTSMISLIDSFSTGDWDVRYFEKTKDDINQQDTPALFDKDQQEEEVVQPEAPVAKELPQEILDFYSPEECEQLMFFSEEDIEEIRQEVIETLEAEGKG